MARELGPLSKRWVVIAEPIVVLSVYTILGVIVAGTLAIALGYIVIIGSGPFGPTVENVVMATLDIIIYGPIFDYAFTFGLYAIGLSIAAILAVAAISYVIEFVENAGRRVRRFSRKLS